MAPKTCFSVVEDIGVDFWPKIGRQNPNVWLGFDGDRLYLNLGQARALSKHQAGSLKRFVIDGNLFIEVYIDKRSYFVIVYPI